MHLTLVNSSLRANFPEPTLIEKAKKKTNSQKDDLLIIDHNWVNESLGGEGVGRRLLYKIVAYAREHNLKIKLVYPNAKAQFDKDDSLADML